MEGRGLKSIRGIQPCPTFNQETCNSKGREDTQLYGGAWTQEHSWHSTLPHIQPRDLQQQGTGRHAAVWRGVDSRAFVAFNLAPHSTKRLATARDGKTRSCMEGRGLKSIRGIQPCPTFNQETCNSKGRE